MNVLSSTRRPIRRLPFVLPACLLAAVCLFPGSLKALDEFPFDLRLGRSLTKIQMYDYALLQFELMLVRYPDNRDRIILAKSRALYESGKRKLGDETIKGIKPTSPVYTQAQLLIGENAFKKRDYAAAAKAYSLYFGKVKEPSSDDEDEVEDFKRAVRVYARLLEQQGKGAEAAKVMAYLTRIKGKDGASDRQLNFLKLQSMLSAEEENSNQRKPVNAPSIKKAIAELQKLQWELDGVAAASFVEVARGHVLLEQNLKAIEVLKMATDFMTQIEGTLKDGAQTASPLAGAYFYYGKAFKGEARKAFKAQDKEAARKHLTASTKCFYKVVQDYGSSPYRTPALSEFGKCKNLLSKEFDVSVKMEGSADAEVEMKMEQAAAFINTKNFASALPLYLEAVRLGRRSRAFPEAALRLVMCFGKTGRFLEAEAVVSYLADLFSEAPQTPDAMLMCGGFMYQAAQKASDPAVKSGLVDSAMAVFDRFVELNATHPKAPDIAFMIAENEYKVASDTAKASQKATGQSREDLKLLARSQYLGAIPKYQRLVNQFSSFEKGVRSLYKLGWIYYSTEQPREAADAFLRYCDTENLPERNDDRLESKFRASEQLMLNEAAPEAVEHLTELLAWLQPGNERGFKGGSKTVKRIKEDATSYLAWSYDLTGEESRPLLREFDQRVDTSRHDIREAQAALSRAEQEHALAAKGIEEVQASFADIEKLVEEVAGVGAVAGAPSPEELAKMTEEERAAAKRIAAEKDARLAREHAKQMRQRADGEKLAYEQEREQIKAAKDQAAAANADLTTRRDAAVKELEKTEERKKQAADKLAALTAEMAAAEKGVADAEESVQKVQRYLDKAKQMHEHGSSKAERQKGLLARKKAAPLLLATQRKFDEAAEKRDQVITTENEKAKVDLAQAIETDTEAIRLQKRVVAKLAHETALSAKDGELLQTRLMAVAKALERNGQVTKVLDFSGDAKASAEEDLKALSDEFLAAFKEVMDKGIEKAVLIQTMANEEMAIARQTIAQAEDKIESIGEERKPVQTVFDGWKQKAEAQFKAFFAAYPKSKHAPDNMARVGTIYLESRQFAKAAQILNELSTKFPDSKAGKEALFNLGRAQCEIGEYTDAEVAFEKLLKSASDMLTPNLSFVSERMLRAARPKVSLTASRELLRRSEDSSHEDYETLRERSREPALYRAGEACLGMEKYDEALTYFDRLLEENENSGYFFEAKFRTSDCRRKATPPDLDAAMHDLLEILQYADKQVVTNRALCAVGRILGEKGTQKDLQLATARFQQVVMLADPEVEENKPWIEEAVYESARAFARLGQNDERDKMVRQYREMFPAGRFKEKIGGLPAAEFTPATPAAPEQ
ncbi:MAG: tetratricopeptide repeat protein [Lentisphaerae bacterium]|jgi:tetratricopeptide (TPR) repeat protein|nr:tetratricopeptide repeat protein [Lentisphaerota bacterium]MBT5607737.1 tetratricopeptide repeat protein [Lentisphaerota bacterium]MBT7054900.1 tetratricopeptide repeat protein [Lentisphaerota bacterium]MBT7843330.1 tetratricopeptide repeat protein [Lentisphaerota bacterium]